MPWAELQGREDHLNQQRQQADHNIVNRLIISNQSHEAVHLNKQRDEAVYLQRQRQKAENHNLPVTMQKKAIVMSNVAQTLKTTQP